MWLLDHFSHNFTSGLGSNKISPPFTVNGMSQLCGSHDYSKSIILTICHHITNTYICAIPPLNICHLCQIWSQTWGRQAPFLSSPSFRSSESSPVTEWSFPVLLSFPIPLFFFDDVELDHILPLLVPVQLHHLPPLCPFLPIITICIWNKNFKKKSK